VAQSANGGQAQASVPEQETLKKLLLLPMRFEMNQGQADPNVKFLVRGQGHTLFLTPREVVLSLPQSIPMRESVPKQSPSFDKKLLPSAGRAEAGRPLLETVRLRLAGANAPAELDGLDELQTRSNYFIGNNALKWRTNVPNYGRVRYSQVYSGVDLVYYGNQEQLEYDFVVSPGTDPRVIAMVFDGVRRPSLDREGNLVLQTRSNKLVLHRPVTYQEVEGVRRTVPAAYTLHRDGRVGFKVAAYDRSKPLIIDPVLDYSTFLSASFFDVASAIAVDSAGQAVVTGMTVAPDFPTVTPPQPVNAGGNDAFITKLNAAGTGLVYSTFVGGSGSEIGNAIALDPAGNVYITGQTSSPDFPLVNAMQKNCAGCPGTIHAFVVKLNAAGNAFMYSTYLGGTTGEVGMGIAADSSGNAYVAGDTFSTDFPVTPGAFQSACAGGQNRPCTDGFVAKVAADGSALVYATYLGGTLDDHIAALAVDSSGNAYVTGNTTSNNFPTTPGSFISKCDLATLCNAAFANAFVTKLNATGTGLVYSTYLGGSFSNDGGTAIAMDATGNAYVAGFTGALDFPTTPGVVQPHCPLTSDGFCAASAFITKFNSDGSALLFSTYLGGSSGASATGIALDSGGEVYVVGGVFSGDFPTVNALQPCAATGITSGFLVKLNSTASSLLFSTCLGGLIGLNSFNGIALDSAGNTYLAASTQTKFPTSKGAFQTTGPGALIVKIAPADAPGPAFSGQSLSFNNQTVGTSSSPLTSTLFNMGSAPLALSSVIASGDFAETNDCGGSVPAASSCTISITFTPTVLGARTGAVTITDNAGDSPQTLALSGTAINPIATLSSTSLTFGNQALGTNTFQSVTLTNTGVGQLTPVFVLGGSGDFFSTDNCQGQVQQGGNCTITIRFTPSAGGPRTGVITVQDNAFDSPQKISASGSSTGPGFILSAAGLDFPNQPQGTTSAPQSVTLTNNGTAMLTINNIQASSPFNQSNTCGSGLAVGASCTINVTFTPPTIGVFQGTLAFSDNLPASPQSIMLTGSSPGTPSVSLSSSSLSFGTVLEGTTSAKQTVILSNTGSAPLGISSLAVVGVDYSQTNNCGSSVAMGTSCAIDIRFSPSSSGNDTTRIDITDNAPGSPHSISLAGIGTEFLLAPAAGASTTQSVTAGQTASFSLTLQPMAGTRDTVTLSCSGTLPAGTCGANPSLVTFTGNNAVTVTVGISTTARSSAGVPSFETLYAIHRTSPLLGLAALLLMVGTFTSMANRVRNRPRKILVFVPVFSTLLLGVFLLGCGGGSSGSTTTTTIPGTPVGSYSFTITAKSASSTNPDQTLNLVLNVR
jgi:hypothetical protein